MADDTDDKVEAPDAPTPQTPPPAAEEPAPTVSGAEDIAKALRATLEAKLAELGLSKGEDGKWDPSSLSADQLKAGTELVGSLLTNLASGVAAAAQQVRGGGAKPGPEPSDDKVIDLDAARRERDAAAEAEAKPRQPSALETRLVGNLRETFNQFVLEHGAPAEAEGDRPKVKIDNDFVRNHGGKLLGALFSTFAGSLLPPDFEFGAKPAAEGDAEPAAAAAADDATASDEAAGEAAEQDVKVQLNVDLPGLFRDLFLGKGSTPKE